MIKVDNVEKPFVSYMQKVIPLAFNESLSYYEQLCLILKYIKTVITPTLNEHTDIINELQDTINKLQNYIDNYFNSDEFNNKITTDITNKLNEMLESGELESIIEAYLKLNVMICFDNVTLMKASTTLDNGSYVKTYGYNELNDKKGAFYKVRTKIDTDVIDETNIIELQNNLVAILILSDDNTAITNRLDSLESSVNTLESSLNTTNENVTNNTNSINALNNKFIFNDVHTLTNENISSPYSQDIIGFSNLEVKFNSDKSICILSGFINVELGTHDNPTLFTPIVNLNLDIFPHIQKTYKGCGLALNYLNKPLNAPNLQTLETGYASIVATNNGSNMTDTYLVFEFTNVMIFL